MDFNSFVDFWAVSGVFGQSEASGQTRSQQAYAELVALMKRKEIIKL